MLEAQRALLGLLERLRLLAERYLEAPEDAELIRSIRQAMTGIVEKIIVGPRELPEGVAERADPYDEARSVYLVRGDLMVEIVAKESSPHPTELADGTLVYAELPRLEKVGLSWTDNGPISSPIGYLTVRVLEALAG